MRKQYHLRHSDRGLLAWDVDRLIELVKGLPRREVLLSEIKELDEEYWFGGENDKATCRAVAEHARLIEEMDLKHPIILSAEGRVVDGMHRVAKVYLEGNTSSEAVQSPVRPYSLRTLRRLISWVSRRMRSRTDEAA